MEHLHTAAREKELAVTQAEQRCLLSLTVVLGVPPFLGRALRSNCNLGSLDTILLAWLGLGRWQG